MVTIKVENKVAENITKDEFWVCGNTDYQVKFEFDEVWNSHELKTALFAFNGVAVPVPFTGNVCEVPKLLDCTICQVGVFAGDLITTTPALVGCKRSITDIGGEIPPPQDDVYEKLVAMIESGMLKGDKGDKGDKGEKGDAGAIKFITVVALPTENIDESAIYLVPIENPDGENRFTEYAYIDGKWETLGAISIQVDHSEYVKFTDYATAGKAGVVKVNDQNSGMKVYDGELKLFPASPAAIRLRPQTGVIYTDTAPITMGNLNIAVIAALTDDKKILLTDDEKSTACETIGALKAVTAKTTFMQVYCKGTSGSQLMYNLHGNPNGNTIALRQPSGALLAKMSGTYNEYELTNMGYVDGLIAELVARIEALENK